MSFNILHFQAARSRDRETSAPGTRADVVSIESRRAASVPPPMPADVLEAIDAADRKWQDLQARGLEVRFEHAGDDSRVTATLRSLGGDVVRPLPLRAVLGDDGPLTAA